MHECSENACKLRIVAYKNVFTDLAVYDQQQEYKYRCQEYERIKARKHSVDKTVSAVLDMFYRVESVNKRINTLSGRPQCSHGCDREQVKRPCVCFLDKGT